MFQRWMADKANQGERQTTTRSLHATPHLIVHGPDSAEIPSRGPDSHSDAHSGTLLWRAARKLSLEHKVRLAPQGLVLRERGWALVQARRKRVGGEPADLTQSLASSSTPRHATSFARLTRTYCYLQRSAPLSHYISSRYTLSVATLFFCYC